MANDIVLIDQPDALAKACAQLQSAEWLALDTEFLRERTYYPRLCLVQIAVPGHIFCIDPLAVPDLGPLFELLFREDLLKVVHAGRQDFEIFHHLAGRVPAPVFDTQLAAPLLGYGDQIGYGNLVRERLGVQLGKAHTRTDWSQRPLSDDQVRYAADDVRYLAELFPTAADFVADLERSVSLFQAGVFKRVQSVPGPLVDKRSFGWDFRESILPWVKTARYERLKQEVLGVG